MEAVGGESRGWDADADARGAGLPGYEQQPEGRPVRCIENQETWIHRQICSFLQTWTHVAMVEAPAPAEPHSQGAISPPITNCAVIPYMDEIAYEARQKGGLVIIP